ncbi:MAG: triose-phosphate isomerase, partial [Amylibacter sp.]|nr:triose-phosphate isomerase [Amylibacter sp.]
VWAIGTGKTPTLAEIEAVHTFIRTRPVARTVQQGGCE